MEHIYKRPPLVEAIYEVYIEDSPGWSQLSYGRIKDGLQSRFDGEPDVLEPIGFEVKLGPGKSVAQTTAYEAPRHRVWSRDRGEMFQFSPAMCAYNLLAKYTRFEAHAADLEEFVRAYLKEAQPTRIAWVGQRYINRISLPTSATDPAQYFHFYPSLPPPTSHRPFALQVAMEQFEGGEATLNLSYQGEDGGGAQYFLDIYARSTAPIAPEAAAVREWQERAHQPVRKAFEAAVTDKAREELLGGRAS